ncbi:MAG: heavy-metal-associated domain-containing protein [Coriobacteriia bacterium]|nr:heavy-metal-associated domain-containing protein [Coriobacteriia bacterium]
MTTIQIKTGGMHCPSCAMLIQLSVEDLPGIESVKASNADGLTTVTFDPAAVTAEAIAEEIRKAGYSAEILA